MNYPTRDSLKNSKPQTGENSKGFHHHLWERVARTSLYKCRCGKVTAKQNDRPIGIYNKA